MMEADQLLALIAANSDDSDAFQRLIDPYRHELLVHCYRILGSLSDAEDALQETFVRAWRRLSSLKEPNSLRAWLYKIATNVSLDMIKHGKKRLLPNLINLPADSGEPLPSSLEPSAWIEPLPEFYAGGYMSNPETRYEASESIRLAFLTALQQLPGRQRAVLILRDVLGWNTAEVSDLLDMTAVAVNSALQRARATMKKHYHQTAFDASISEASEQIAELLARYVQAWEAADSGSLIALLREDAAFTMPPLPLWFQGRTAIKAFLDHTLFAEHPSGHFRLRATRANASPAFAVYTRDDTGVYRRGALHVLTIEHHQITRIDDFLTYDDSLFLHFRLPLTDEFATK